MTLELTRELNELVKEKLLVGFSVAIYNDKGALYEKGFGYSDKQEKKDYTKNTIQNIGSVSKTFIGIALLKAQELGKLNLDDPINDYLPFQVVNPYYPNDTITIRQITTHTSSIRDRDLWYGFNNFFLKEKKKPLEKKKIYFRKPGQMISMKELFETYLVKGGKSYKAKSFFKYKPGTHYNYSNIAATLGAYIVEQATKEDFKTFTQKYVFDPLQMNNTGWSFKDVDFDNHSRLYTKSKKRLALYSMVTYPDGGLITSSSDMAKYASELIKGYLGEGTILTKKSYKEAFTGSLDGVLIQEANGDNCGVFFDITAQNLIGHGGSDPGIASLMFYDPKKRVGRYLQTNTDLYKKNLNNFLAVWDKLKKYETQFE
ncbi:serine hydrolase domain-containing protein [Aquimarina aquimarini]|uniref:serine hydrolase domain-containing protein n=1 Tax=Aquimarina aquimarini TaxID=1191734 RepID=UPI001F20B0BC|nr:serine hydrolase domain-containing protein [Aquimarina aquimarini]